MSGLSPATVAVIYLFAGISIAAVLAELTLVVRGWPMPRRHVRALCTRVISFLERAGRDIVAGFLNSVEWLLYGRRYA